MLYFYLKIVHVVFVTFFFGAGMGSALMKLRADRTGDPATIVFAQRHIVWADWVFTVPSGVVLPLTGLWMADRLGIGWLDGWIGAGVLCYVIAGVTWLPAAYLQIRMRRLAEHALATGQPLDPDYRRFTVWWAALGVPAFGASMLAFYIMVTKQIPWLSG